jgi:hypothetical protein
MYFMNGAFVYIMRMAEGKMFGLKKPRLQEERKRDEMR